ncbi:MAG: 1-acyl-sn-glycerol-3-phosphate acyltransferase [Clostridia bacterium]|nr:1-acyl-sn-glycerol-3-phosphate acyltransferase [Clostridia bacterium]
MAETKKKKKKSDITVKANKKGRHIIKLLNFLRVIVIPSYWLFKPFRFYGNRKVKDGACVYVCNHYGLFDAVFPAATTWEGIHYLAKKENFEAPILGWLLGKVKAICANRDGNDVRAILDCFKCLKNGEKICIFPEGTRNKTEAEMLPFHHGAAAIAIKCKTPILPIMMYKRPRFFRRTHVLIGEPFELTEYYDRKLTEAEFAEADNKIRDIMLDMRKQHAEYLENKKKKKAK